MSSSSDAERSAMVEIPEQAQLTSDAAAEATPEPALEDMSVAPLLPDHDSEAGETVSHDNANQGYDLWSTLPVEVQKMVLIYALDEATTPPRTKLPIFINRASVSLVIDHLRKVILPNARKEAWSKADLAYWYQCNTCGHAGWERPNPNTTKEDLEAKFASEANLAARHVKRIGMAVGLHAGGHWKWSKPI